VRDALSDVTAFHANPFLRFLDWPVPVGLPLTSAPAGNFGQELCTLLTQNLGQQRAR
jgi:hypothetical protein